MKLELFVKLRLRATHFLEEREAPHAHVWRIEAGLTGTPVEGRLVSLPLLRDWLAPFVTELEGTFLNESGALDPASRQYPTCENLAVYFFQRFEEKIARQRGTMTDLRITSVSVAVDETDGEEYGWARYRID